jgi:hypothetical protein
MSDVDRSTGIDQFARSIDSPGESLETLDPFFSIGR